jgi:hypothetical protein
MAALAAIGLACMPEVVRNKVDFRPSSAGDGGMLTIAAPVDVGGVTGFHEVLERGSTWRRVGSVPQGDVYKRVGGVFMLTGRNAHEASLVVSNHRLVGFYLPGEGAFAPAASALELPTE